MIMTDTLKLNYKQLSQEEIELFMRNGYLVVHDVFPKEIAGRVIPIICEELKINMHDLSTWPKHLVALQKVLQKRGNKLPSNWAKFTPVVVLRKNLDSELLDEIYTKRYTEIIDDLCGHGRWRQKTGIGHWPILFPIFKEQGWQPVEGGWHLDGDFKHLSINSSDWGLILMHLFTDIQPGGGGTAVRIGSHHYTARILAEAEPDGIEREDLIPKVLAATKNLPVKELIGNNGDIVIMHPWIVHSSSLNTSEQFRIAANKHVALHAPMNFSRNIQSDFSAVELAVIDSVKGKSYNSQLETVESKETSEKPTKQNSGISKLRHINAKDLLRIIILRTNTYFPFSFLYKKSYELGIKAFAKLCSNFPEIKSVYLRHPLLEGTWTPALSDIDLTVIMDKGISPEKEFNFLSSFWKKFYRLKKLFPMYGEIYLIRETDFELWQELEFEGANLQNWTLIGGTSVIRNENSKSSHQTEAFNQAFSFYLNYFLDLFNHKGFSDNLVFLDLIRIKNKILKCLRKSQNLKHPVNVRLLNSSIPSTDLLCNIIEELEKSLAKSSMPSEKIDAVWKKEAEIKNNLLVNDETRMKMPTSLQDKIQCVYLNFSKKIFIILKDGLDQQTFINCIETIVKKFSSERKLPVILNINLFKYFLRQYEPFEYGHFMSYRTLAFGTDILSDIEPSDKSAVANHLKGKVAEILKFPFSQKFSLSSGKWNNVEEFKHIFDVALMIKYYLEFGKANPLYQKFLDNSYEAYPELVKKIEDLRIRSKQLPDNELHKDWFNLFKELADDIYQRVIIDKNFRETPGEFPISPEGTYGE